MDPTEYPNQWAPESISLEMSGRGVELTTDPQLMPRLIIHGAISPHFTCITVYTFWCGLKGFLTLQSQY